MALLFSVSATKLVTGNFFKKDGLFPLYLFLNLSVYNFLPPDSTDCTYHKKTVYSLAWGPPQYLPWHWVSI